MKLEKSKLQNVSNWVLIIMTLLIICSILLNIFLVQDNKNEGFLINTSGKQRYLSQKITKTTILLVNNKDSAQNVEYNKILNADLQLFKTNNEILIKNKNSEIITTYLMELQPYYELIFQHTKSIQQNTENEPYLKQILETEPTFLQEMNKIVLQFELENKSEIQEFEYFIVASNILLLFMLLFLMLKVIRPSMNQNH